MSHTEKKRNDAVKDTTVTTYDLFILSVTILSLFTVLIIFLPYVGESENSIAREMDFVFCMIFLADFFHSLRVEPDRKRYFLHGGWLDLAGSIPFIPILRLLRLARALRIARRVHSVGTRTLLRHYRGNVVESAFWTTALATILLLVLTTLLIVPIESQSPDAQITNPSDAIWWSVVTATTVGYGDMVPVTSSGKFLALLLMTLGVTFLSILTSYFTSKIYLAHGEKDAHEARKVNEKLEEIDRRLHSIEMSLQRLEKSK